MYLYILAEVSFIHVHVEVMMGFAIKFGKLYRKKHQNKCTDKT